MNPRITILMILVALALAGPGLQRSSGHQLPQGTRKPACGCFCGGTTPDYTVFEDKDCAGILAADACREYLANLPKEKRESYCQKVKARPGFTSFKDSCPVLALYCEGEDKALPADVGPGRVAWFDITTTNLRRSTEFYGKLFGWQFTPVHGTDQAMEIVMGGIAIGTLRVAEGKISTFNGLVYVQVADIQAACKKAKDLGGTVVAGFPFNLPNGTGAIGVVVDPAGHPVGMYSRTPLAPARFPK